MRTLAIVLLAIGFAACGREEPAPQARTTATPAATATPEAPGPLYSQRPVCKPAGAKLRLCMDERGYGSLRSDAGPLRVEQPPGIGRWVWAAASPDARTILMQWSAECEVPIAYLVSVRGGRPRRVMEKHVNSKALGWTTDGRAIVFVPAEPGCGSGEDAGLFLVDPRGGRTRIGPGAAEPPLKPRVRPRAAETLSAST